MSDLNQCSFIGRLGANPQMRTTQNGEPMATFSIAVSEKWHDKQGNRQEKTEWVNITAFGKLAEIMGQYLTKGSQVFIQGKFTTRKYTDNNGIERYATSIQASQMHMFGGNQNHQQTMQGQQGYLQAQMNNQPIGQGQAPQSQNWQAQPQGYQSQAQTVPQGQAPQAQYYQSINHHRHPTNVPVGQMATPTAITSAQVPDDDMPF